MDGSPVQTLLRGPHCHSEVNRSESSRLPSDCLPGREIHGFRRRHHRGEQLGDRQSLSMSRHVEAVRSQTDVLTSCRQPGNPTRCGKSWCVPCGVLQNSSKTLQANCRATTHVADDCSHSRAVLLWFHLSFERARAISSTGNETGSGLSIMRKLTATPWMSWMQSSRSLTVSRHMASFEFTRRTRSHCTASPANPI